MPVIVIGADTVSGGAVAPALTHREGEVRAFVTDLESAGPLRRLGIKVAVGDVSDSSHIDGAARRAFVAVLIAECGTDDRERAFAASAEALSAAWAEGLAGAGVHRLIWVGPGSELPGTLAAATPEWAVVNTQGRSPNEIAAEVGRLDNLASLDSGAGSG